MDSIALARPPLYLHPAGSTSYIQRQGDCSVPRKRFFSKNCQAFRVQRLDQVSQCPNYHDQNRRCGFRRAQRFVINAISPEAISAAVTVVVVGASTIALIQLNKDKIGSAIAEKPKCEACNGTGLCSSCNGEGFLLKNLSTEAAAKARANAKDAASRYTAGLAKKWSYCINCSGSRGCPACEGRGWLAKLDES